MGGGIEGGLSRRESVKTAAGAAAWAALGNWRVRGSDTNVGAVPWFRRCLRWGQTRRTEGRLAGACRYGIEAVGSGSQTGANFERPSPFRVTGPAFSTR